MRKIYIDCGAWEGDSILSFKKFMNCQEDFEIFAFECNPELIPKLKKLSEKEDIKVIEKAVWVKNTSLKFYPGTNNRTKASTLYSSKKKKIDRNKFIEVKAIDFSKWIKDNFKQSDYIICKFNIEGAEYDILEKMIKDKTIYYIDKLYIAFHQNKISEITKERHIKLEKNLSKIIKIKKWTYDGMEMNPF